MTFLIAGKNGRGELSVLGTENNETKAQDFAKQAVVAAKVSEVYVLPASVVYFASQINRANPDQDQSLAGEGAPADGGVSAGGLNGKPTKTEGASKRPEVNAAQASGKEPLPKDAVKKA